MLKITYHKQFKKDYKSALKKGYDKKIFYDVFTALSEGQVLPPKYKDHALNDSKYYKKMRECHIKPDLLLIYKIEKNALCLSLIRTGSHSKLFKDS